MNLTCKDVREAIAANEDASRLTWHMTECADCAGFAAAHARIATRAKRSYAAPEPTTGFEARVAAGAVHSLEHRRYRLTLGAGLAVAAATAAVFVFLAVRGDIGGHANGADAQQIVVPDWDEGVTPSKPAPATTTPKQEPSPEPQYTIKKNDEHDDRHEDDGETRIVKFCFCDGGDGHLH